MVTISLTNTEWTDLLEALESNPYDQKHVRDLLRTLRKQVLGEKEK